MVKQSSTVSFFAGRHLWSWHPLQSPPLLVPSPPGGLFQNDLGQGKRQAASGSSARAAGARCETPDRLCGKWLSYRLTPVDTRGWGFPGATGVTENEKTPGNPGYSHVFLLYEDPALTTEPTCFYQHRAGKSAKPPVADL